MNMSSTTSASPSTATNPAYRGYIDPNWPNPGKDGDAEFIIYGYVPSIAVCGLGIALFTIALVLHAWLLKKYRTWYFSTVLVATLMEMLGYIFRTLSSRKDPYLVSYFVAQYFEIVVAPVLLSAAIYTIVSELIEVYGRDHSPIPPGLTLWGFVACDIIATIVQITGAGLIGSAYSNQKDPNIPNNILLAGLAFQVFTFALFLLLLAAVLWKSRASSAHVSRAFLISTVVATLAIYLRTIFRLAETAEGLQSTISTYEVFFGCLEFAPIVIGVYLFAYWHPGRYLRNRSVKGRPVETEAGPDSVVPKGSTS